MKYFISYTLKDKEITKELLKFVSSEFQKKGSAYVDLIDNDSVDKQERVLNELDNCDVFVLIESKSVYSSKWVQIEIERAKLKNKNFRVITLSDINVNEKK